MNPPVLDSNSIFVPFAKTEVSVEGAVESPGAYEFVDGDTIASMLEIAGGLRRGASRDSVELRRFVNDRETAERVLETKNGEATALNSMSVVEKVLALREVDVFQGMPSEQLAMIAAVAREKAIPSGTAASLFAALAMSSGLSRAPF